VLVDEVVLDDVAALINRGGHAALDVGCVDALHVNIAPHPELGSARRRGLGPEPPQGGEALGAGTVLLGARDDVVSLALRGVLAPPLVRRPRLLGRVVRLGVVLVDEVVLDDVAALINRGGHAALDVGRVDALHVDIAPHPELGGPSLCHRGGRQHSQALHARPVLPDARDRARLCLHVRVTGVLLQPLGGLLHLLGRRGVPAGHILVGVVASDDVVGLLASRGH